MEVLQVIADVNSGNIASSIVGVLMGGGLLTGIVALFRLKPESDQIVVSAAKDVVFIQRGVVEDLRAQYESLEKRFDKQTAEANTAILECHAEREELRKQRDLQSEQLLRERENNRELRVRVDALEGEVSSLRLQLNQS